MSGAYYGGNERRDEHGGYYDGGRVILCELCYELFGLSFARRGMFDELEYFCDGGIAVFAAYFRLYNL